MEAAASKATMKASSTAMETTAPAKAAAGRGGARRKHADRCKCE
jgi:hypothetical protein